MKKTRFNKYVAALLCFIMITSIPMISMAKVPTQEDIVEPQLSLNYSDTPFAGTQASWYTVYKGTDNRSQAMDAAFWSITTALMLGYLKKIVGLAKSNPKMKAAAEAIISNAIAGGFGGSSNFYYTVAHYQNKNNSFQEKRIIKYYSDKAHTDYLYSQTVYVAKVPLS